MTQSLPSVYIRSHSHSLLATHLYEMQATVKFSGIQRQIGCHKEK